jgi:hypothetical protein
MPSATLPFFTSKINKKFRRTYPPGLVPALDTGYVILTLFEFLEKLDARTTRWTSKQAENTHYQRVKVKNKDNMRKYLAQYLCRGKIGVGYGIRAVERSLISDDYDILIIASPDINKDVIVDDDDSDSEGSVTSNTDSQSPSGRLRELKAEAALAPLGVPSDYEPEDSDVHDDPVDSNDYFDLEDSEESEDEDSQGRPGPAWRPDPKGKDKAAQIRSLKKQKDDSVAIRKIKLQSVMGFLIVQKGECAAYPKDYAVNLICVKDGAKGGTGQLLIGLYLYTILTRAKTTGHLQLGLLELAGGYYNIAGLCLYSKFGFVPAIGMAVPRCFDYPGNMPMELHFNTYPNISTLEDAANIVCSIVAGDKYHPGFKLPICNVKDLVKQNALIALREYDRLIEYRKRPPYPNIDRSLFDSMCSRHPDLDLINGQAGSEFENKVYGTLVPDLIRDMESVDPVTLQPNVNLDENDKEFLRIISSVGPLVPRRYIQRRFREALMDFNALCIKLFTPQTVGKPQITNKTSSDKNKKSSGQSKRKTLQPNKSYGQSKRKSSQTKKTTKQKKM